MTIDVKKFTYKVSASGNLGPRLNLLIMNNFEIKKYQAKRKLRINIKAMYSDAYLEYFGILGKKYKLLKIVTQDVVKQLFFQRKLFINYFCYRYEFEIELVSNNFSNLVLSFEESSDIWYSRTVQLSRLYGDEIGFLNDINKFRTKNINRVFLLSVEASISNKIKGLDARIEDDINFHALPAETLINPIPIGSSRIVNISNGLITSQHFVLTGSNIFPTSNIDIVTKGGWPTDLLYFKNQIFSSVKYNKTAHYNKGVISKFSTSWYHFLIDSLPLLLKYKSKIEMVPYLYFGDIPSQIKEILTAVTGTDPISMPACTNIEVKNILFLQDYRFSNLYDFNERRDDLESVRNFFVESENQSKNLVLSKKVFLAREAGLFRNLKNAPEVHQVLSNLGFEIVYPNRMNLKEQIELYSRTKVLVAETGAALVNTLFLPENSLVVELKFGEIDGHIWPGFIAHKKLDYVQCQMKVNRISGKANLDLKQLLRIIENLT
jgi:hypothetical protein